MKRVLLAALCLVCLLSCSDNTKPEFPKDLGLAGTKWTRSVSSTTNHVIEFIDNTTLREYETKNGAISGSVFDGKYSYSNGKVTFGGEKDVVWVNSTTIVTYYRYTFRTAEVSGDVMTVNATTEYIVVNLSDYTTTVTNKDPQKFTYMKGE